MSEFFCEFCKQSYASETSFIEHFKQTHTNAASTSDHSSFLTNLQSSLKAQFPAFPFVIKTGARHGAFLVELLHEGTRIEQYVGKDQWFSNPLTIEECVEALHQQIAMKTRLLRRIEQQGLFEQLHCHSITYGNVPSETRIRFSFQLAQDHKERTAEFYPEDSLTEDQFIQTFAQYFTTFVEGPPSWLCTEGFAHDCAINGIPLAYFAESKSRVRISKI